MNSNGSPSSRVFFSLCWIDRHDIIESVVIRLNEKIMATVRLRYFSGNFRRTMRWESVNIEQGKYEEQHEQKKKKAGGTHFVSTVIRHAIRAKRVRTDSNKKKNKKNDVIADHCKKQARTHVEAIHWSVPGILQRKNRHRYVFCLTFFFLKRDAFVRLGIVLCAKVTSANRRSGDDAPA